MTKDRAGTLQPRGQRTQGILSKYMSVYIHIHTHAQFIGMSKTEQVVPADKAGGNGYKNNNHHHQQQKIPSEHKKTSFY